MDEFPRWKAAALSKVDLSKKGSVDAEIFDLVNRINAHPDYFTTSSCSGRILICSDDSLVAEEQINEVERKNKKGCTWYLVSHTTVNPKDACAVFGDIRGASKLKFEPFVLHVQCRQSENARTIHQSAIAAGFRNSGITFGKRGKKIISAVRGTACLEVPLTDSKGTRLTTDDYVRYIVQLADRKLEHNFRMVRTFEKILKAAMDSDKELKPKTRDKPEVYMRKRRAGKLIVSSSCEEEQV